MGLAIKFEGMIREGVVKDYAELVRLTVQAPENLSQRHVVSVASPAP